MAEQTMIEDTPKEKGGWARGEKLVLAAIILFGLNLLFLGLGQVQLSDRDDKLDRLEDSVVQLQSDVKVIRAVADSVGSSDEQRAAQAQFFQQFSEIYTAITGKQPTPPTTEEQPGG